MIIIGSLIMTDKTVEKKKTANSNTITPKDSQGSTVSFPDVCETPSPAEPIPIPYPNIAKSSDMTSGTKKVKIDFKCPTLLF